MAVREATNKHGPLGKIQGSVSSKAKQRVIDRLAVYGDCNGIGVRMNYDGKTKDSVMVLSDKAAVELVKGILLNLRSPHSLGADEELQGIYDGVLKASKDDAAAVVDAIKKRCVEMGGK